MRSLRSGVATAAIVAMWSSAAFGFNLFGSSDEKKPAPKPAPAEEQPQSDDNQAGPATIAKTIAANLDTEIAKAKAQRQAGAYHQAAHAFAQMVLVAPDDARVVGEYGKTLVLMGRSDDAIAFLKRAIQLSPEDATLYSAIGAAFDQKSRFADARTAYERSLQLKPGNAATLNNYAMSRMLSGDLPGAQALIAQASAAGHDPKIAANAELMANLRGQPSAPAPEKTAVAQPLPVSAKTTPVRPAPKAAKTAAALPKPVTTATLPPPVKTAAIPASEKPHIVKTEKGRVMMQAVPEDPHAGPVNAAEAATKSAPAKIEEAKAETAVATTAPHALASAAQAPAPRTTPDLRAASD
jgi:Flp pilus assembly protein TadD